MLIINPVQPKDSKIDTSLVNLSFSVCVCCAIIWFHWQLFCKINNTESVDHANELSIVRLKFISKAGKKCTYDGVGSLFEAVCYRFSPQYKLYDRHKCAQIRWFFVLLFGHWRCRFSGKCELMKWNIMYRKWWLLYIPIFKVDFNARVPLSMRFTTNYLLRWKNEINLAKWTREEKNTPIVLLKT